MSVEKEFVWRTKLGPIMNYESVNTYLNIFITENKMIQSNKNTKIKYGWYYKDVYPASLQPLLYTPEVHDNSLPFF